MTKCSKSLDSASTSRHPGDEEGNPFNPRRLPAWSLALLGARVISLESVHRPIEVALNAEAAELRKRFPMGDPSGVFAGLKLP